MEQGAKFSDCGKYRFILYRIWDRSLPFLMLVGLNPSTANDKSDDPTIRRVIGLAKANEYGGIYMMNLFPFVTPYPKDLKTDDSNIETNDLHLRIISAQHCKDVCFCWGNFDVLGRDKIVKEMFPDALCFGVNQSGSPKHPLYLPANTKLINFNR